ncbi:unnamed protein product [Porites evermanni]|uniref:Uncharacterized protein n=1 Tax=Porites evermanni TaxID=104178 RepID=A0ABN8T0Y2_9CNID|nr:unnamed protein product [Porites evermanni]
MARRKEGLSSTDICALLLFISQVALQASTTIDAYLKLIRYLNETNRSSLRQAINATDELLSNFKASKENTSILFAAQALEVFVKSFAKRQLTAANDTFMQSGKEIVIIMKKVQSNSEDLVVSGSSRSQSDRLQESDVHIRLPASMFDEKGGYLAAIVYSNLHKLLPSEAQTFLDGIPTESGYIGSRIFAIAVEPLKYPLQGRALFDFGHLKVTFIN